MPASRLLVTILFLAPAAVAAAADRPYTGTPTRDGDLLSNLSLLNLWQEKPEHIQRLYEAAYRVLAGHPGANFADVARAWRVHEVCDNHGIVHLGGPMLGAASPDGMGVWLRTTRPAPVTVEVSVNGETQVFGPVESTDESGLTAIVPISGLQPATRYPYRVLVDGVPIDSPQDTAFVTAPPDSPAGKTRIAFGSCFHRWGLGNRTQAATIQDRGPAALLLLGDIAVQDRNAHLGRHRADYLLRDFYPAWRQLAAAVPIYATWDDHDYFDNDLAGIPEGFTDADRRAVWRVWRENWNNPEYGFGEEGGGVFLRTRIGPADIIMVDNRYFREPGAYLGNEQMEWLERQLRDCAGPFIILSCGTMWSDYVSDGKDSWGAYDPEGRERIFNLIEELRIGGVLLISGDRHGARGFRIPRPSGFSFYEFGAASLGGRRGPPVTKPEWDTQLYGFEDKYAFGEFEFDAALPDPEVTFRLIQSNGDVLYALTLKRSQLTPPE